MIKLKKLIEAKNTPKNLEFIKKTGLFKIDGGYLDWAGAEYISVGTGGFYYTIMENN